MISLERYRQLLAEPGFAGALAASIPGRLPIGMAVLAILLCVQQATGSFAAAGATSALYLAGIGALAPFIGRLIDRFGPGPVMRAAAVAYPLSLLALVAAVLLGASATWTGLFAAAAGATLPPVSICMRALIRHLMSDAAKLQSAYSLDSVLMESIFILGPAVVALVAAVGHPAAAVVGAAAFGCGGGLLFVRAGALRGWRPDGGARTGGALGPLREPGMRALLAVTLLYSLGFGLYEVAVTGVAAEAGAPAAAGWILAATSIGSAVGALAFGSRSWPLSNGAVYRHALAAMGLGMAVVAPLGNPTAFAAVSVLAGVPMSVVLASQSVLITGIAPRSALAESFTWSSTCLLAGVSGGIALGGAMLEVGSATAVLLLGAAATWLGLGVALLSRETTGVA